MKPTPPAEHFIEHHGLQGCVFWKNKGDVIKFLKENGAQKLLLLQGMNEDSKIKIQHPTFADLKGLMVDTEALHLSMCELRVRKTQEEIRLMRHVSTISTKAHVAVMKQCLPGMMEYQLEALFKYYCMFYGGDRFLAYSAICACAEDNSATLHYHQNSDRLVDGGLCLLDMGCEYFGYVSDITNTFPVNGKFTDKQRGIYLAVKAANEAVQQAAKPGVTYLEMHILANRVLLEELVKLDIVRGNVDEMMEVNLAGYFQPHGLGHMIGYDVHDVGGYTKVTPSRPPKGYGLKNLRTARCLEPGMCITIEPGCYFVDALLDEALDNPDLYKFLNPEVLNSYRGFGGVRIEDCVLITETGVELLSKLPREPEQIELMMAEAAQLNGNFVTPSVMEEPKAL
ncbi:unnamed protein product [Cyprideis torosa]|uniref:Uncharacterized protein n=1 Tax=Cyprideis torosa TaxID=163714 RepID=A0A7R8WKU9_9CRUS|nr:unnamed protein product [Cyprideis torosa]CAG0903619.1 unnamed protein product [Cyprideis torosa]